MAMADRFIDFLASSQYNGMIWAPTQVGKSAAMLNFIEACFSQTSLVILSTDNKIDQCEQLFDRIKRGLGRANNIKLLMVSDPKFQKRLRDVIASGSQRSVVFCLNNHAQIMALMEALVVVACGPEKHNFNKLGRIAFVHDEADTITKDPDTENINEAQAESHKAWLQLFGVIQSTLSFLQTKRMFVTATPENCCMLYEIKCPCVFELEIPEHYTGYKQIVFEPLSDVAQARTILHNEVERIRTSGTNEVVLYCIDRKIGQGQDMVLVNLSSCLDCLVNTYNGKGIGVAIKNERRKLLFESLLSTERIPFSRKGKIINIRKLSIRKFYSICKKAGECCVVTIGKDLIARGISYVGEDLDAPLTATTMIYKPGLSMHAVGINQAVGRITGCAMPNLRRKLYAPEDVIKTYVAYNNNQLMYINKLKDMLEETANVKDVIDGMSFQKFKRSIDRKNLQLEMHMPEEKTKKSARMCKLIDNWWTKDTILGRIFRYLMSCDESGVNRGVLLDAVTQFGSKNADEMCQHLTNKTKGYNQVYMWRNTSLVFTEEASKYIQAKKTSTTI
jgi:hypothetical protein